MDREKVLLRWLAAEIIPHEQALRRTLRKMNCGDFEDDVIQEAYCKLAAVREPEAIDCPRAYFFQVAKNIVFEQLRRRRIVHIESVAEIERLSVADGAPSPEREVAERQELDRVARFIADMPARRRRIFILRKIDGRSQREIAAIVGVTENVVEKEIAAGVRLVLRQLAAHLDGFGGLEKSPVSERRNHGEFRRDRKDRKNRG